MFLCYRIFIITDSLLLPLFQEEEEYETKGGRRRTWDDDYVLKRQFSALVPAFDPRPGRTNVQQTTDLEIPPPGMLTGCICDI